MAARHNGRGLGMNGVWERTGFPVLSRRGWRGGELSIFGVGRGEWQTLRPTSGVAGPHRLRRTLGQELSIRNSRTGAFLLSLTTPPSGTLLVRPFVAPGSAPSLRPVLCSTFLRGVSRKVSRGGVPHPWPRDTAHPPIGRAAPPLPLLTQYDHDPEEDSRGRNSGG